MGPGLPPPRTTSPNHYSLGSNRFDGDGIIQVRILGSDKVEGRAAKPIPVPPHRRLHKFIPVTGDGTQCTPVFIESCSRDEEVPTANQAPVPIPSAITAPNPSNCAGYAQPPQSPLPNIYSPVESKRRSAAQSRTDCIRVKRSGLRVFSSAPVRTCRRTDIQTASSIAPKCA
jgi:hypothetical protein